MESYTTLVGKRPLERLRLCYLV